MFNPKLPISVFLALAAKSVDSTIALVFMMQHVWPSDLLRMVRDRDF